MRLDMGCGRKTADDIPKFGRTVTCVVEMIDQKVRQLLRSNELGQITARRQQISECGPIDLAPSLRAELRLTRG